MRGQQGRLALAAAAGMAWLTVSLWPFRGDAVLFVRRAAAQKLMEQSVAVCRPSVQPTQPEEPEQEQEPPAPEQERPSVLFHLLEAPEEEVPEEAVEEAPKQEPDESTEDIPPVGADAEDLELTNSTDHIELELGDYLDRPLELTLEGEGPQILIMHTHGTEAYSMADGDEYVPSDHARTTDEEHNMIRVGEEIKAVLEEMGLQVIHDTSLYDYPGYNGSYGRSLKGIAAMLEQYPTIRAVLDVHRDALIGADGTEYPVTDTVDGEQVAQVMLVVGTDDGGLEHPRWQDNLTLAARIQGRMLDIDPGLPRPVNLRSQRFNQHMTAGSLLVEVGTSGNTLQEAVAGARLFARAAGLTYLECMEKKD